MADNSFDLYTIAFGIRNVPNVQLALEEAFRVLKPGGRFLCMEFSHVSLPVVKEVYDAVRYVHRECQHRAVSRA
jgi:ubiquinone/menaquinone biosynthesis C-methylase UbiE